MPNAQQSRLRVLTTSVGVASLGGGLVLAALIWARQQPEVPALAHGICFSWFPRLLYLHVVSDGLIALAYYSIPVSLFYFARKRADLPYAWLFILFGAFIVACGTTHLLDVWTVWNADYWASGVVKAITAAVSLPTAIALYRMVPRALLLPSPEALRQANVALYDEVRRRQGVEAELREAQAVLEQRVAERTRALHQANALLDSFFQSAPVGLAVLDEAGRFVRVNEVIAQANRLSPADHLGRTARDVLQPAGAQADDAIETVLRTGQAVRDVELELPAGDGHGRRVWSTSYYPVPVEDDRVLVGVVSKDVTSEQEAQAERERLRQEAEHANRMKDEFLAKVSHELRTPLQATMSWTQLLGREGSDPQTAKQALGRIDHNVRVLARIVSDLLDTSRVLSGTMRLDVAPADLAQTVRHAVDVVRPQADAKGVALDLELTDALGRVRTDASRVEQVVWNLVANAVQATPSGGRVQVRLSREGSTAVLAVSDTGAGIAAEELALIFEPFRQGRSAAAKAKGGLGLGLSIVRSIVGVLDGTLSVHSDGLGRGARFEVGLPVTDDADDDARDRAAAPHEASPLAGVRLLHVEDEDDVAVPLSRGLRALGAEVVVAPSFDDALRAANAGDFDALVSDLDLGDGGSGFDVLRALRALRPDVPAVAVSAYGDDTVRTRSAAAGFDAHLVKPVAADEVSQAVLAALRGRADAQAG